MASQPHRTASEMSDRIVPDSQPAACHMMSSHETPAETRKRIIIYCPDFYCVGQTVKPFHIWLENACYKKYKEMNYLQKNRHEKWMAVYLSLSFWTPNAWVSSFHTHPLLPRTPTTLFWSKCKTCCHFHCKYGVNLSQKMTSGFKHSSCWCIF